MSRNPRPALYGRQRRPVLRTEAPRPGIRAGDIIAEFGEHAIEDVYGYMYALGEFEPGDEV